MKHALFTVTLIPMMALMATTSARADNTKGQVLHNQYCVACHSDSVYKRDDRRVTNLQSLQQQVSTCSHAQVKELTSEQLTDIVDYLNATYYKFK
jgi:cytochrome c553